MAQKTTGRVSFRLVAGGGIAGKAQQQPFDPGITQSNDGTVRRIVNRGGSPNVRRHGRRLQDFHLYQPSWRIDSTSLS